ncbi:hypothetical protein Pdw03_0262 [Penicillium digitatum]|uniref:Uncharacterized protein n=1 Tax=Penicillium digitatum TaxID=36651 RepID=A0A7T7BML9_PENDI|nr:hypothetical protein Pdw03_0262 [Penicillium digitatum]
MHGAELDRPSCHRQHFLPHSELRTTFVFFISLFLVIPSIPSFVLYSFVYAVSGAWCPFANTSRHSIDRSSQLCDLVPRDKTLNHLQIIVAVRVHIE